MLNGFLAALIGLLSVGERPAQSAENPAGPAPSNYASHPPMRPLPVPSSRPMADGPAYFADAKKGDDGNPGTKEKPWRTIQHGIDQLKLGDTLYLRGGIYYENVTCKLEGHKEAPITIRSYPNELAFLDAGIPEFLDDPAGSWEPFPDGAEGEYVSARKYPGASRVAGFFAESMVPMQSYKMLVDLREDNIFWNLESKAGTERGIYCGPGVWYNTETERIHIRLRHHELPALPKEDHYLGETDPRKLRLVLGLNSSQPLAIESAKHVRFRDLVVRCGAVRIYNTEDVTLDNVTVHSVFPTFGGSNCLRLKLLNCAFRGMAAPWSFRGDHKYRSMDKYLFSTGGRPSINRDWEIAYCEFTDDHDGPHLGATQGLRFHHNLVDNFNDDGLFVTARSADAGDMHVYQNWISRILTSLAFGYGHQSFRRHGKGIYLYRNIFELIRPVHYGIPGPEATEVGSYGRVCSDHGSPTWEPMTFYHNTFVAHTPGWRGYCLGLGYHMDGTRRRVFNNIFVVTESMPGSMPPSADLDFAADGNLFWSPKDGPKFWGSFFEKWRASADYERSKQSYPPGWEANGFFADPMFVKASRDWRDPKDYSLRKDSPAIDAGVPIPEYSPDPLAELDQGKPDIGALPYGVPMFKFGQQRPYLKMDR